MTFNELIYEIRDTLLPQDKKDVKFYLALTGFFYISLMYPAIKIPDYSVLLDESRAVNVKVIDIDRKYGGEGHIAYYSFTEEQSYNKYYAIENTRKLESFFFKFWNYKSDEMLSVKFLPYKTFKDKTALSKIGYEGVALEIFQGDKLVYKDFEFKDLEKMQKEAREAKRNGKKELFCLHIIFIFILFVLYSQLKFLDKRDLSKD